MKKVIILATDHCLFSSIGGPMDMLLHAGALWSGHVKAKQSPFFDVKIATVDGQAVMASNQVPITPHCSINEVVHTDLIIIPSQGPRFNGSDPTLNLQIQWMVKWHKEGADLASIGTGAFTLAETGLLNGKKATTHRAAEKDFRARYPKVELCTDQAVIDEGNLLCSRGTTADLNLTSYLINRYCGSAIALQSSLYAFMDLTHKPSPNIPIFLPEKNHQDFVILKIQEWIEKNSNRSLSMEAMAERAAMSPRNFHRRFKQAVGETALNYLQMVRIEAAKRELETSQRSFDEISYDVGYKNVSFFRRVFKRSTGLSPSAYKKKVTVQHTED
ncbi:helix-turn-helix domain-containing protein [Vibrio profundum]|uniref:GlxA family transcriptional regulator n=1 Tax=Vibrio profundum TaxID=2910247 RepID=UPI003D0B6134